MNFEECVKFYSELSTVLGICGASLSLPIVKQILTKLISFISTKSNLILKNAIVPILKFILQIINLLIHIAPFLVGYIIAIGIFNVLEMVGFIDLLDILFILWQEYIYHAVIISFFVAFIGESFIIKNGVKKIVYNGCAVYWMFIPFVILGFRMLMLGGLFLGLFYGFKLITNTKETLQKTWEVVTEKLSIIRMPKEILEKSIPYLAFFAISISLLIKHLLTINAICY